MTELERKQDRAPVPSAWTYASAPEARDIVTLQDRYGHYVGGEWLEARETYTTISPATEEPLADVGQATPEEVQAAIEQCLPPYERALALLQTIPGVKPIAAAAIVAEIGTDMSRFPSAGHLASWAGLCPSNKESAGKRMKAPTNHGNVWLRAIMGEVAWASVRTRTTYFHAQFQRLARRRGPKKASVAVAHSLLIVIYHVLRNGTPYAELGVDYFNNLDTARMQRHHVRRLEQLGYKVVLTPIAA